jgi:hypothetical protein
MKMKNTPKLRRLVPLAVGGAVIALSNQAGLSQGEEEEDEELEAQLFFELNDTDGDLGIQGFIDADAWKRLEIEAPDEQVLMNVWVRGNLRRQGMNEFFFESEEPTFDELSPAAFLKRFPQGIYEIEAVTLEGQELEAEVRLSHVLAGPPGNVRVNGKPGAVNCDAVLPVVSEPVRLNWNAVTQSHPTIGKPGVAVTVERYQVVGEIDREGKVPDEVVFSVDLPRNVTVFEFPVGFTSLSEGELQYELITRLTNGNLTAVESCVEIEQ